MNVPKVQVARSKSPDPPYGKSGPVLLSPDPVSSFHKIPEKQKSPPRNKLKIFFSGKSKEEKEAKRASRVTSPIPHSPPLVVSQPKFMNPPSVVDVRAPSPTPVVSTQEWENGFDGTHRPEPASPPKPDLSTKTTPQNSESHLPRKTSEEYRPATPPTIPIVRSETPTRDRSDDEDLDRWAQIRRNAEKRRAAAANVPKYNNVMDDVAEVNVVRSRQTPAASTTAAGAAGSPKRKVLKPDEEDEESVDARVARIRKRVQELTAGMGDD